MKKYILEEKEEINKKAFFVPISPIFYKVKVSSTDFFTKRTIRKKVSWQTYENKKHMFKSMMISGTFLLFLLIIGVFSVVSSTIPKTNEFELTKAWIYFTKLDVEKTRVIQKTPKKIRINGQAVINRDFQIMTNIDEILSYLDIRYEEFALDEPIIKEKVHEIHENLWMLYSTEEEDQLHTSYFTQIIEWTEELTERMNAMLELGQYQPFIELKSPFMETNEIKVNQRYGYYLENQEKRMFQGIQVQAEKNKKIIAPMAGKTTVNRDSITIQSNDRQLIIKNIFPKIKNGQTGVGEVIGTVAKTNEVVFEYSKNGRSLNPGFYFEKIDYLEMFPLDQLLQQSSFDEATFRQLILFNCHAFSDKADKILIEAKKNGISPVIFAAIMIHESAWGTSKGIVEKNNPAGLMTDQGLISYPTLDEGIEATGRTLKNLIIDRQLNTIEKLGTVYCPVNAANDPMGLNRYWVPMIKQLMGQLGGSPNMELVWTIFSDLQQAILTKAQSIYQKGVQYSQGNQRGLFPYHDCSSFVIWTMNEAGINTPFGNTETLYRLEGTLLHPISYEEVKAGDLFVWGKKGESYGNYGHTGFFLDDGGKTIIHCTPATEKGFGQSGDIVITPFEGYSGDPQLAPVYFYRIVRREDS
jgi:hypothetical protein